MLSITILIDNTPADDSSVLAYEHGLSLYISTSECDFLCDTGKSELFASNAELLGIDLEKIKFAVMSHGHNDHTGGLAKLLSITDCPVYISQSAKNHRYYSLRHENKRNISTDSSLFEKYPSQFKLITESQWITPNIALVQPKCRNYATPYGNNFLLSDECKDSFEHEFAIAVVDEGKLTIISPCSHSGAANIITSCRDFTSITNVKAFVGGLHFVESDKCTTECSQFVSDMQAIAPNAEIFTGHCTSIQAQTLLKDSVSIFKTGKIFNI